MPTIDTEKLYFAVSDPEVRNLTKRGESVLLEQMLSIYLSNSASERQILV